MPTRAKTKAAGARGAGNGSANLTDRAYDVIKRRIIELKLAPGVIFTETQLAKELKLSKTPVREALARLRREHLVEVSARSGYRASSITLQDARDLFALRMLLEEEAVRMAARHLPDPGYLSRLEELCRTSYRPDDKASITQFLRANTEFHGMIARASGNPRLADMLLEVLDQMERLFHVGLALMPRSDQIVHEHRDLLNALISGDEPRAAEIAVKQLHTSQGMVIDALMSSPNLLTASVTSPPRAIAAKSGRGRRRSR